MIPSADMASVSVGRPFSCSVLSSFASFIRHVGRSRSNTRNEGPFTFTIVPTVNPDGYVYSHEHSRLWRKNRQYLGREDCVGEWALCIPIRPRIHLAFSPNILFDQSFNIGMPIFESGIKTDWSAT